MFKVLAKLMGRNIEATPKSVILDQMHEMRPLPMGRKDFEEWSDRIISGALIPRATVESQKGALATLLMHLGPTESHKPDAFFIHSLRVFCVKEVAIEMQRELKATRDARVKADAEEAAKKEADKAVFEAQVAEIKSAQS